MCVVQVECDVVVKDDGVEHLAVDSAVDKNALDDLESLGLI